MPTGRKPKGFAPDGTKLAVNMMPSPFTWTEVVDEPNTEWPKGIFSSVKHLPTRTQWWVRAIRELPHTRLWKLSEWLYLVDSAETHAKYLQKPWDSRLSAELRRREDRMGASEEARKSLRIKYIQKPQTEKPSVTPDTNADDFDYDAL